MKTTEPIVKADEYGNLLVPKELLDKSEPNRTYKLQLEGGNILLSPVSEERPFWAEMTPAERARNFLEWVEHFKDKNAPGLSDWAVSRDSIYD